MSFSRQLVQESANGQKVCGRSETQHVNKGLGGLIVVVQELEKFALYADRALWVEPLIMPRGHGTP